MKEKLDNLASVAEVRLANWQKYEKAYNETEELLDKQIEATYKVVEENKEAKEIIEKLLPYAKTGKHDKQDLQSIDRFCDSIHKAEQFLKESE